LGNLQHFFMMQVSHPCDLTRSVAIRHNQAHDERRTLSVRLGGERDCRHHDGRPRRDVLSNVPLNR